MENVFGTCPNCGGGDLPALSGADAAQDTSQKEYLKKYHGRWLCERCIENEKSRSYSAAESIKMNRGERLRARMGFE